MKIEAGKYYRTQDGRKVGPMKEYSANVWHYDESTGVFRDDGTSWIGYDKGLIAEWQDEPPTTGTLKELDVKAGDVVEMVWNGILNEPCREVHDVINGGLVEHRGDHHGHKFHIISRATATQPTIWRDMTPEEKGALLLAHHQGKTIERLGGVTGRWFQLGQPQWRPQDTYRVRPEPVVQTVVRYLGATLIGTNSRKTKPTTHKLSYNIVDEVIDCTSVKLEEL